MITENEKKELEEMMVEEKGTQNDWSSDLMNHLLMAISESAVKIPKGFQLDGISMQRYTNSSMSPFSTRH